MAHAQDLLEQIQDPVLVEQLKQDYTKANISKEDKAILDYAVKLTKTPQQMTQEDIGDLKKLGFSEKAIFEAVQVIGFFNSINRIADALGIELEEDMK